MRFLKYFSIFVLIIFCFYYAAQHSSEPYIKLNGQTMGTYYNIKIHTSRDKTIIDSAIRQELQKINHQMSVFDNDSEISRINQSPAGVWIDLSPAMSSILKNVDKIYKQSHGYFDPTVGQLVDLWGFGVNQVKKIPDDNLIKQTLKTTGFDKLIFNNNYSKVKKLKTDTYLNLSAIAKGYGVDVLSKMLSQMGFHDFVVEIGGEVRAEGRRDNEVDGWNIGVVNPDSNGNGNNAYVVTLKDSSVATSGDYRNYFYVGDKRFSHTISPETGRPVEHNLASVTVFANNCMDADAYATAIMSMGEKKGLTFANNYNLAVIMFVHTNNDGFETIISKAGNKFIKAQQ